MAGYDDDTYTPSIAVDGPDPDFDSQIDALYQELLGRSAGDSDRQTHRGNPKGIAGIRQAIMDSPEYKGLQATGPAATSTSTQMGDWAGLQNTLAQNMPKSGGGGGGGGSSSGGIGGGSASTAVQMATNPQLDAYLAQLMKQSEAQSAAAAEAAAQNNVWKANIRGQLDNTIRTSAINPTSDDPIIRAQSNAYRSNAERALGQGREALAARAGAEGLPTGAFDAAIQGSYDKLGQDTGTFEASLLQTELNSKRSQLMQALSLGAGLLTADENRLLQDRVATIDAVLNSLKLKTSAFTSGVALDQGQQGITNQNTQFYDTMGYNVGLQEAMMNLAIMNSLRGN